MFHTKFVQAIKTHILCPIAFFFWKSCRLWDNVENYCTTGRAKYDNMAHAFGRWITKATYTHSEYVILIPFSTAKIVARTHLSLTLYVHCLSC